MSDVWYLSVIIGLISLAWVFGIAQGYRIGFDHGWDNGRAYQKRRSLRDWMAAIDSKRAKP